MGSLIKERTGKLGAEAAVKRLGCSTGTPQTYIIVPDLSNLLLHNPALLKYKIIRVNYHMRSVLKLLTVLCGG